MVAKVLLSFEKKREGFPKVEGKIPIFVSKRKIRGQEKSVDKKKFLPTDFLYNICNDNLMP